VRRCNLDDDYRDLVEDTLANGEHREGRNGGFTSRFGCVIRHDLRQSFPIISTRKIFWRPVLGELSGFLDGAQLLSTYEALGCNYWRKNAEEWPAFDGDNLGPIYGAQWRNFGGVDQLCEVVSSLKMNPSSRRHIMTTWNPPELDRMCLPPCHVMTQFHVARGKLHQTVTMRSVDLCLGLPSDLVLYGMLQHLVAREVGLEAAELAFMLGDAHVYDNHDEQWQAQREREGSWMQPAVVFSPEASLFAFHPDQATIINYQPHEAIKYAFN